MLLLERIMSSDFSSSSSIVSQSEIPSSEKPYSISESESESCSMKPKKEFMFSPNYCWSSFYSSSPTELPFSVTKFTVLECDHIYRFGCTEIPPLGF